jgi:2-desacetyl-2-hydroxyethyl bacteriochlorophyllide A dehydrogenase
MKSVVLTSPGHIVLKDLPVPVPGEGAVRLRVELAGICSTDRHIYLGHFPIQLPRVLGHELVGRVDAVGAGLPQNLVGQMVGVCPARFCGECSPCRRGLPELCINFECLGNTQDGGFAEYTLVREEQLVPLDELSPDIAVWLEPLACVLHALDSGATAVSQTVLVAGAGVLGKLMVMALCETSQARLAVVDPNPDKIQQALELGAQAGWVVPRSGPAPEVSEQIRKWAPDGVETVIDTSGSPQAIERAIEWSSAGARILLFGVSNPKSRLSLSPSQFFEKEIRLSAAAGMTPSSFIQAESMLRAGRVDPRRLASTVVNLNEVPSILAEATLMQNGKVLVRPNGKGA